MSVNIKVGTFTEPVTGGTHVIDIDDLKLLLVFGNLQVGYNSFAEQGYFLYGFAVGTVNDQVSNTLGYMWNGLFLKEAVYRNRDQGTILYGGGGTSYGSSVLANVSLASVTSTQATLTFAATVGGFAVEYSYIAIGGSSVTSNFGSSNSPIATGSQAIAHGFGNEPTLMIFTAGSSSTGTGQAFGFGFTDGVRQGASCVQQKGDATGVFGGNPSVNNSYQRTDKSIVLLDNDTGAVVAEASCSFDDTNFTLDWTTVYSSGLTFDWIALTGLPCYVGSFDQRTSVGSTAISAPDVRPVAVYAQSHGNVAGTIPVANLRFSFGVSDGDQQLGNWDGDNNGITATGNRRSVRYNSDTDALISAHPTGTATGTVDAAGRIQDLEDNGFLVNWPTTVDATARQWIFFAVGTAIEPAPPDHENLCTSETEPIIFAAFNVPDEGASWFGQVDLPHNAAYYGGWKEDRLLTISPIRRSLAGPDLDYEIGTFDIELADEDYVIRAALTGGAGPYFTRWEIDAYMATKAGMDAEVTPFHIATGLVDTDPDFDTRDQAMTVRLSARDRLGVAMGWTLTGQTKLPRRAVSLVTLPGAGPNMNGKSAWLPWGVLTNNIITPSGLLPPYPSSYRGDAVGPYVGAGPGYFNQDVDSVTSVLVTASVGGDCPERAYSIQVFAAMNDGRMADPFPYYNETSITIAAPNQTIDVAWPAVAGADKYYVALFASYSGWRLQQFIETTSLSCSFNHAFDTPDAGTGPATGASIDIGSIFSWYKMRSRSGTFYSAYHTAVDPTLPDYELPNVPKIFAASYGLPNNGAYRFRPNRLYWTPSVSPDIDSYEILKEGGLKFVVAPVQTEAGLVYFNEDWIDTDAVTDLTPPPRPQGRLKPKYTRDVILPDGNMWHEVLIAGAAIKNVDDWYYDPDPNGLDPSVIEVNLGDGVDFLFPKSGGAWESMFATRYRDIQGTDGILRRFTLGYIRNAKGDLLASGVGMLSLNIQGIEDVGDSTGDVITDVHDQLKHFLNYFVLASGEGYLTGTWGAVPTQGYDNYEVVNSTSFETVKAMRDLELDGGLVGAGITGLDGEFVDTAEELQRWMVSMDARLGPNRDWQIELHAIDTSLSSLFVENILTDVYDIHKRTFKAIPRLSELQNVFKYRSGRDASNTWLNDDQDYLNLVSIGNWNVRKQGRDLDFHYVENALVVGHVLSKHVKRRENAPMYATLEGNMCLLSDDYDIGRYFKLTHWRGVGSTGWNNRVMWVISTTFLPDMKRVRLECLDVTRLLAGDAALLEAAMDIDLGGSWYHSPEIPSSPATVNAYEYRDRQFPWSKMPDGTTLTARLYGAVPSGVSMTLQIYDPDSALVVATDPDAFTSASFALHTFQMPVPSVDTVYRLRAVITGGSGNAVAFNGSLRPTLP